MKIEFINIDELKEAEYNPRIHAKAVRKQLKKSIEKFGFVEPVVVNSFEKRKNVIIGGHFRVDVAKELGYKQIPCVRVEISDIEKEKELNLRLNKNVGSFDYRLLADVLPADALEEIGFSLKEIRSADFYKENTRYNYSTKIFYEPIGLNVTLSDAIKTNEVDRLLKLISESKLSDEEKKLLSYTAYRFTEIRFDYLAEIYSKSKSEELKKIFEELLLVVIDYDKAIERGFVQIDEAIAEAFFEDLE